MKRPFLLTIILFVSFWAYGQEAYTRADSLRGTLTPLRTCYDVTFYDLKVTINPYDSTVSGSVLFVFNTVEPFSKLQFDLFDNMDVYAVVYHGDSLIYTREHDAVFVNFKEQLQKGTIDSFTVHYGGQPTIAARAPWDGGLVWAYDKTDSPWIGVACEGDGASLWWPCKDHLSDEPDSMMIRTIIPIGLVNISNGRLVNMEVLDTKWRQMDWKVSSPINTYNVTINVGRYESFSEVHINEMDGDTLTLDYFVLPENLEKAKEQFKQVKPMMKCFEQYMGKYPYYEDGYKLIETSYLGMEHQSAISYGNKYLTGYAGMDFSRIGLTFDYIIIHETGHEWWGNHVSMQDLADMWIHEGFCTYSEAIYVECMHGYDTAMAYVNAKRATIENDEPIIAAYGVNKSGSGDMYNKGMLMLNTLRTAVDNDTLWWITLQGIQQQFGGTTTNTEEIVAYMNKQLGQDYTPFFDQYLRHTSIPVYEYELKKQKKQVILRHRWVADVDGFALPVRVATAKGKSRPVLATTQWTEIPLNIKKPKDFVLDVEHLYVEVGEE